MLLSKSFDVLRVNTAFLTLSQPLFFSGSSIQGNCFNKAHLVVVKDFCLRSAFVWVYHRRALRTISQEKLPNEPATAKGAEEPTPLRPQELNCQLRLLAPQSLIPLTMLLSGHFSVFCCGVEAGMSQMFLKQP